MLGGLALIAERRLQRLPPASIVAGVWVFATFLAWGIAFGWVHDRIGILHHGGRDEDREAEDVFEHDGRRAA